MIRTILFILLLPVFFSCYHENQPEVTVPEQLLSEDEMVLIITDIQLAEGALTYRRTRRVEQQGFRESAYKKIFSNYGITAKILNENVNYYNSDPERMELIYEKVLANLSRMEGELTEGESMADSIASSNP
jgi:hypothetical protein